MVYVVTGATGQLGHEVVAQLEARGADYRAYGRDELDIANYAAVNAAIDESVHVVINCAAYTAVDDAEDNLDAAWPVNAEGPGFLAELCERVGARLVHVSTDYVFDGEASEPYAEDAETNPQTVYGKTKVEGENAALFLLPENTYVVRTAWVYGAHGSNFVKTMLGLAKGKKPVHVVMDQVGQPTWAGDVATALLALADADAAVVTPGVYHYSSEGACSWFEFAREIFELSGHNPVRVVPAKSDEYARRAVRPAYSVLAHDKWLAAGLPAMRDWREALAASGVVS